MWPIILNPGVKATKVEVSQGTSRDSNELAAGCLLDQRRVQTSETAQCCETSVGLAGTVTSKNLTQCSCALAASGFLICNLEGPLSQWSSRGLTLGRGCYSWSSDTQKMIFIKTKDSGASQEALLRFGVLFSCMTLAMSFNPHVPARILEVSLS
jgi:hypothetical protein